MDWLILLKILGASIIGFTVIGIIAKYTGIGDVFSILLNFVSQVFDWMRTLVSTIVNAAPKPIKVGFFLILFVLFGGIITSVVGIEYVCYDGNLYKANSIADALTYNALPDGSEEVINLDEPEQYYEDKTDNIFGSGASFGFDSPYDSYTYVLVPYLYDMVHFTYAATHDVDPGFNSVYYYICYNSETESCYMDESCSDLASDVGRMHTDETLYTVKILFGEGKITRNVEPAPYFNNLWLGWTGWFLKGHSLTDCKTSEYSLYGDTYAYYSGKDPVDIYVRDGEVIDEGSVYNVEIVPFTYFDMNQNIVEDVFLLDEKYFGAEESYEQFATYKEEFVKTSGNFNLSKHSSDEFVYFACEGDEGTNKSLRMFGIPILDIRLIGAVVFLVGFFGILSYFRK